MTTVIFPDEDPRPWELAGGFRRDCAPHRAPFLNWLGIAAVTLGWISFFTLFPVVVALPLGVIVKTLAQHDLDRMQQGVVDPQGWKVTEQAREYGSACTVLSLLGLLFCGLPLSALIVGLWMSGR
jgi:hypothetical protein